jgi:DNA (cytosine-5)-methyltransferase 1
MTTFGSVCSGIEAASVAWSPLGWQAAWLSEIEPGPCSLLAHHYPDVRNVGDMTRIPQMLRNGDIPAPDVFCGGTPCQAFSVAGLRNSLDDARGNLSLIFCNIADEIDIQRAAAGLLPCIPVWENVPGVLSTKDNAFGCFLGQLAGEDCALVPPGKRWPNAGVVYGPKRTIAWRVLDAQYFGVAQRRKRVLVVGSAREGFDPAAVLFEFDGVRRNSAPSRSARQDVAGSVTASLGKRGGQPDCGSTPGYLQPVGPVLRGGNTSGAINVAACLTAKGQRIDFEVETFAVQALSVALRGREGGATADLGDGLANCLRASGGGGDKAHVLAPIAFSSKDYGGDATFDLAPTMRAMNHSGSHPNAGGQLAVCVTGDITHTLKAEGFDASEDGTGRGQPIVAAFQNRFRGDDGRGYDRAPPVQYDHIGTLETVKPWNVATGMAVRRLTPRECERLQGFPDDYTLIPNRGKPMADGPRYKALGNSWAVPKFAWLGERIDAALRGAA